MKACEERFANKANEGFSLTVILMPALSRAVTRSAKRRARRARLEARR
jgi:hypothetical protein